MHLTRAQVTDISDPEGLGRVRLRLPRRRAGSGWVAVASPAAGDGHGLVLKAAIGDVALVAALDSHGRELVVIGFLWTAASRPAGSVSLRTRDGLSISLDDAGDRLVLSSADGARLVIGGGGSITISAAQVTIDAAIVHAAGVMKCDTLIAKSVNASSYSPGAGNIM